MATTINLPQLQEKIELYIREFQKKPRKLKETSSLHRDMLVDAMRNMIIDIFVRMELVRAEKNIVMVQGTDARKCLRHPPMSPDPIGKGFFGKVYKVNSKTVAKISSLLLSPDAIQRMTSEIDIAKKAGELGVGPKVYDTYACCSRESGCVYIIYMQYLRGQTLQEWLKKERKESSIQRVRRMVQKKIDILHKHNILHNDIHDENIYLKGDDKHVEDAFIIDYGMAGDTGMRERFRRDKKDIDNIFRKDANSFNSKEVVDYTIARLLENKDIVIVDTK